MCGGGGGGGEVSCGGLTQALSCSLSDLYVNPALFVVKSELGSSYSQLPVFFIS